MATAMFAWLNDLLSHQLTCEPASRIITTDTVSPYYQHGNADKRYSPYNWNPFQKAFVSALDGGTLDSIGDANGRDMKHRRHQIC